MRDNLEEMVRRGKAHIPVLLGGAALTRSFVEGELREVYPGPLFYGKDAFEALRAAVLSAHPYELPELIAVDIDDGHPPYLQWITESLQR